MSDSLLPSSATKQERDIALATARISDVPTPYRALWSPDDCPLELLPWLAWSLSVDDWDPEWSEPVKRAVVRDAADAHRRKGTIGSIRELLEAVGYPVEFVEWFDDPELDVHEFILRVLTGEAEVGLREQAVIRRIIDTQKPLRSHMADYQFEAEIEDTAAFIGCAVYDGEITVFSAEA